MSGEHFCIFESGENFFAAPATHVGEITSAPNYAKVPGMSGALAGLWHEGSEFLPVLRIPGQKVSPERETQVLIVHGAGGRWGLLVERVHNIEVIECSQTTPGENGEWSAALMGMSTWNGHSVRVLNLEGLYRLAESELNPTSGTEVKTIVDAFEGQPT